MNRIDLPTSAEVISIDDGWPRPRDRLERKYFKEGVEWVRETIGKNPPNSLSELKTRVEAIYNRALGKAWWQHKTEIEWRLNGIISTAATIIDRIDALPTD